MESNNKPINEVDADYCQTEQHVRLAGSRDPRTKTREELDALRDAALARRQLLNQDKRVRS